MKPFSPFYFIKENTSRCLALMMMIFLSFGCYLGGLYVTNPLDNWKVPFSYYDTMRTPGASALDADFSQYTAFRQEMEEHPNILVLEQGQSNGFPWTTVMGFEIGTFTLTFRSVEDFKAYCEFFHIDCDFSALSSGSLILSERLAKNKGLALGDVVDKNYHKQIYNTFTVDALTAEEGYCQYYIDDKPLDYPNLLLLPVDISTEEFLEIFTEARERNSVAIYNGRLKENILLEYKSFNMIYTFIVILLSVILAVTINAAFVGMYQRRNFEFAVYRAIGISKHRIIGKIIGELVCLDFITLAVGGGIFFLALYLFNNLVLYPTGKYLNYFHPLALTGLLLCNLTILVPLIITRCRQLLKADICEY